MKAPGTAYDDPVLGRDPQPASHGRLPGPRRTTPSTTTAACTNSGIPNRAFYLAASTLGGFMWERAGQIWFDTITAKGVPKDIDFAGFAARTVAAASKRYGTKSEEVSAVEEAWATVGVDLP